MLEGDFYIANSRIKWMIATNLSPLHRAVIAQQLVGYSYHNGAVTRGYSQ